jgi:hypothetical protein
MKIRTMLPLLVFLQLFAIGCLTCLIGSGKHLLQAILIGFIIFNLIVIIVNTNRK